MSQSPNQASVIEDEYVDGWKALFEMLYHGGSLSGRERNCCFLNTGEASFVDVSAATGFDFADDGRALAKVDWDHDGRLDVWTMNRNAPRVRFLKNVGETENQFVALQLKGTKSNRDAIGARVILEMADGRVLAETLTAGSGYLSQSSKWIHFGLGKNSKIDSIKIQWPNDYSGAEVFTGVTPNHHFKLVEGTGKAVAMERLENRRTQLRSGQTVVAPLQDQNRIVLAGRVPVFEFDYEDSGGIREFRSFGKPTLITFWASWCPPCIAEIETFAKHDELQRNLNIILLSGDKETDRRSALRVLNNVNWRGTSGFASERTLNYFETLQNSLLSHKQALLIPTSFLIDAQGRLAVIYKGTVEPTELLQDIRLCWANENMLQSAIPFPGRWFEPPSVSAHSQIAIATNFTRQGESEYASKYLSAITSRIDPAPLAAEAEARHTLAGAQLNLAKEFYQQGEVGKAVDLIQEAIRFAPNFAKAHFNLGVIQQEQGDASAAIDSYESVLKCDPSHDYANFNLATIYESSKPRLSENYYSLAIEANPEFTKARYNLGLMMIKTGNYQSAEQQFEAILEYESNANAHYQLGNIALAVSDSELAMSRFEKAIASDPMHADAMTNLAAILFAQKKFERTLEMLSRVARIRKDDAKSQFNYGIALLQNERFDEAIAQIRKTLEINDGFPTALLRLAQALVSKPNASKTEIQEAIEFAKLSAELQPKTAPAATSIVRRAESILNKY